VPAFGVFEAWHAHNELLQLFYAYGIVGLMLFITVYGSLYLQLRRHASGSDKALFYGLLLFIVIRGFGDTDRFELTLPLWFVFLISALLHAPQFTPIKDGQS
jgi:O-antigen ligase